MAVTVHKCLNCSKKGAPFYFENYSVVADKSCPMCGESRAKRTPRSPAEEFRRSLGNVQIQSRIKGSAEGQTWAENYVDEQNKLDMEENKDKYMSGEWTAKIPKNRPKEFDPSWLNEKRLF